MFNKPSIVKTRNAEKILRGAVPFEVMNRLWGRYARKTKCKSKSEFEGQTKGMLERRLREAHASQDYVAPKSLYPCWKLSSNVSEEFFTNALNESGILQNFCSEDQMDIDGFGATGRWEQREGIVEGGAMNPPFTVEYIQKVITAANAGVQRRQPYCRVCILPMN